jgi:hypothetical protein
VRFVWESIVGLVIEDSQLAIGIVVALAITWGLSTLGDKVQDVIGWLLLVLLIIVLLGNLVVTVRRAKRRLA